MKLELTEAEIDFLHEYLFLEYEHLTNTYGKETEMAIKFYDLSQKIFYQLCRLKEEYK